MLIGYNSKKEISWLSYYYNTMGINLEKKEIPLFFTSKSSYVLFISLPSWFYVLFVYEGLFLWNKLPLLPSLLNWFDLLLHVLSVWESKILF